MHVDLKEPVEPLTHKKPSSKEPKSPYAPGDIKEPGEILGKPSEAGKKGPTEYEEEKEPKL